MSKGCDLHPHLVILFDREGLTTDCDMSVISITYLPTEDTFELSMEEAHHCTPL